MKINLDFSNNSYRYTHFPGTSSRAMFFYPLMAGYEECGSNYFLERDDYNDYLILYTVSGHAHLEYRGKEYNVEAGECLFLLCNEYHSYHTVGNEPWVIKWLHFNGSLTKFYFNKIYAASGPVIRLGNSSETPETIDKIIDHLKEMRSYSEIVLSLLITEILTDLLLIGNQNFSEEIPEAINKAISYIDRNYSKKPTLDEIASNACISKFYLSHKFKQYTGYAVHEYILMRQLDESKKLLLETDDSVTQIAKKLGFDVPSHYSRVFKKKLGYTPLKYRRAQNQQPDIRKVNYSKDLKDKTVEF